MRVDILIVTASLAFFSPVPTSAMSSLLVKPSATKCVVVEAGMDVVLMVDYEAPDVELDESEVSGQIAYLTIDVTPANRVVGTRLHEAPVTERLKPTKVPIDARNGTVYHKMELGGDANICIRAPVRRKGGKSVSMHLFSLRVQLLDEIPSFLLKDADINDHLSYMEREMDRIERTMKTITRQADYAKDKDATMHQQFLQMHSTTMYWPIVQLCVLLVTGYTQASHIVHFFKTRRII